VLRHSQFLGGRPTGSWPQTGFTEVSSPEWKQESSRLSCCVRITIAKRSPARVLETGPPMEALEKNRCNGSEAGQRPVFSGPVGGGNTAKSRPFSHISLSTQQNFSAVETTWRRELNSNLEYSFMRWCKPVSVSDLPAFHARSVRTGETNLSSLRDRVVRFPWPVEGRTLGDHRGTRALCSSRFESKIVRRLTAS
jgi:hypothetical protein